MLSHAGFMRNITKKFLNYNKANKGHFELNNLFHYGMIREYFKGPPMLAWPKH